MPRANTKPAHQVTAQLFEYPIGSGQDTQLKTFASRALPVVMQHLEIAEKTLS
jgi:putative membrane protein